jgi:hypothetical protein
MTMRINETSKYSVEFFGLILDEKTLFIAKFFNFFSAKQINRVDNNSLKMI